MAANRTEPVQSIGVATSVIVFNRVFTTEVGVATSLVLAIPRRAEQAVGVVTSIRASIPRRCTEAVGVGTALVVTLPTDSRATWTSVVLTAPGTLHEVQPLTRRKLTQIAEYGTLTIYVRTFALPRGNNGQAILETVLAPGSHLQPAWEAAWFSLAVDGPKLANGVEVRQQGKQGADEAEVRFIAIKTLEPVTPGAYNATARRQTGADAFGTTFVEWGIAPSLAASGIPVPGDVLFGSSGAYAPKCINTVPDDTVLPGRWLIRSTYRGRIPNDVVLPPNTLDEEYSKIDYRLVIKPKPLHIRAKPRWEDVYGPLPDVPVYTGWYRWKV